METLKKRVVSGVRATGKMHLGNYLGVLERLARLSREEDKECFFFVADLHTLTTLKDAALIRQHAPNIVLDMLAAGVDPSSATIYMQSDAPQVTELSWLLACLSPVGDLESLPTFKDKSAKQPQDVNGGLLFYPVLMAADILGPKASFVPVGQDQKPHLEFTRSLARRFNRLYGNFFPIPDEMEAEMVLVPGLATLNEHGVFPKMGKSEAADQTIYLSEPAEEIRRKVMRAPTDPARVRRTDPGTPTKCAIFSLHTLIGSGEEIAWSNEGCRSAEISCVECKEVLVKNIEDRLGPFRERRSQLMKDPNMVRDVLASGGKRAREVFKQTTEFAAAQMGIGHLP